MTTEIDFQVDQAVREAENQRLAWDIFKFVAYNKTNSIQPVLRYVPKPDSIADRTITYLKKTREGTQLSKKDIARLLDANVESVESSLWRAVQSGLLERGIREELYTNVAVWFLPTSKASKKRELEEVPA
jgi:hypothetical protein